MEQQAVQQHEEPKRPKVLFWDGGKLAADMILTDFAKNEMKMVVTYRF